MNKSEFQIASQKFLENLIQAARQFPFINSELHCDHICYRTETLESYEKIKNDLISFADKQHESLISARPIAVFKLHDPIMFNGQYVDVLELASPKQGSNYAEGFEHAEFVVEDLQKFMSDWPDVDWETSGLSKIHNPEIRFKLAKNISVKFHCKSLQSLVNP